MPYRNSKTACHPLFVSRERDFAKWHATAARCIRSALLTRQGVFCLPVIQVWLIDGGINCATESNEQIVDTDTRRERASLVKTKTLFMRVERKN
jgi:hypothetical protein